MPGRDEKVSDEEIIDVLERLTADADGPPVFATSDIADELPINQNRTLERLKELKDEGKVDGRQSGARLPWNWWLPGESANSLSN